MPYMLPGACLPVELPEVSKFQPTATGEPPLGHATRWAWNEKEQKIVDTSEIDHVNVFPLELNTMPGFAGSSAYYIRYMDPHNDRALVSREADEYWRNVDLYIGGTEHATGHLIYSRFWNKFLFDLGLVCEEEPFKKLINQGMIQGRSNFVYRINGTNTFVSLGLKDQYDTTPAACGREHGEQRRARPRQVQGLAARICQRRVPARRRQICVRLGGGKRCPSPCSTW